MTEIPLFPSRFELGLEIGIGLGRAREPEKRDRCIPLLNQIPVIPIIPSTTRMGKIFGTIEIRPILIDLKTKIIMTDMIARARRSDSVMISEILSYKTIIRKDRPVML